MYNSLITLLAMLLIIQLMFPKSKIFAGISKLIAKVFDILIKIITETLKFVGVLIESFVRFVVMFFGGKKSK